MDGTAQDNSSESCAAADRQRCSDEEPLFALRAEIDAINAELLALLEKRGRVVREIARHKARLGLRIHDPVREREMLQKLLARASGPYSAQDVALVFRAILKASRRLGRACLRQG